MYLELTSPSESDLRPMRVQPADSPGRAPRIAIYSHDAQGLGHLRRNMVITRALTGMRPQPSVLMISGLREAAAFDFPRGVDNVTLPAMGKSADGVYSPRSLGVRTAELIGIRRGLITAAIESFRPDVFIVDKQPRGLMGELEPALRWIRANGARAVLGLRDILDSPETVRSEWEGQNCYEAIREFYDRIWVYGDRAVYDQAREYGFPEDIAGLMRYTGYLNPRQVSGGRPVFDPDQGRDLTEMLGLPRGSLTLCLIGGGRDGVPLASAFLQASLPRDGGGVLIAGPLVEPEDREDLRALASSRSDMRVVEFLADPYPLLCCADQVVAMGGYNTVCEALAFHKRTLIVPRVVPRTEQLIRAERLSGLGLLDVLHPNRLTPDSISEWIAGDSGLRPEARAIDFEGVGRIPELFEEVRRGRASEVVVHA